MPLISEDNSRLASCLNEAFYKAAAHAAVVRATPPIGARRKAFEAISSAGRQFLRAVGLVDDPDIVTHMNRREILEKSATLREFARWAAVETDVLGKLVDSLPLTASLVKVAEAATGALPASTRRGPLPKGFNQTLLQSLALCHRTMFGELPKVQRDEMGHRSGPSLKWLRKVLGAACKRLNHMNHESELFIELQPALRAMVEDLSIETLGRELETAVAAVRARKD